MAEWTCIICLSPGKLHSFSYRNVGVKDEPIDISSGSERNHMYK